MVVACSVGTVEVESPWEASSDWACDGYAPGTEGVSLNGEDRAGALRGAK